MLLSEVKRALQTVDSVLFQLDSGAAVPIHFHVTEVGSVIKNFIDCGGTVRTEQFVGFQLWEADDFEHRLAPAKLLKIIADSERILGLQDGEVEVEYQAGTVGKYGLSFDGSRFVLESKTTNCLAQDRCGIPQEKVKRDLRELPVTQACAPNSGCC